MPIVNVIQRGLTLYVYNEKNLVLFTKPVGIGPNDGLKGYTGQSVNVQQGRTIYTYNEKGRMVSTKNV